MGNVYLSSLGLSIDLIGVLFLGADVIRIQRTLKKDSADRLASLNEIIASNDTIGEWLEKIGNNADWREWQWEEGRTVMVSGTFDYQAAQQNFKEALQPVSDLAQYVKMLGKITLAGFEGDAAMAVKSLRFSYIGITLIVIGFAMQIWGSLT